MFLRSLSVLIKPLRCTPVNKRIILKRGFSVHNTGGNIEIPVSKGKEKLYKLLRLAFLTFLLVDLLTIRRKRPKVTGDYSGDRNEEGQKHGRGIMKYSDGSSYDGEWSHGVMEGYGTFRYANGDVYTGNFIKNKPHGRGLVMYKNENIYDGEWSEGLRTGDGTLTFGNGSVYLGVWKNGVPVDAPDGDSNVIHVIDEGIAPVEPKNHEDSYKENKDYSSDFTDHQNNKEPEEHFPDRNFNYTSTEDRKD